ncbi:MFS transporter [Epidermidibacterium keratini]|uniref:Putative proline/betaine transporter n=2 Tax=Epidermidibacterium keratini TaxID=1891644 RepID=A0A7L4YU35_9ACTN|nr:MFS transporter [Epidermidibacterium keratini]
MRRVAVASLIGTTIEFYDFYAYGIAAALVLNTAFFPELSDTAGTLAAFSTYAVAFAARPIGAIIFGHWGDRIGRKAVLIASLLTMGIATVLIGLLPGYETLGIWAAAILVVLRFLQGVGLGGEWGGAALLATEHAPEGRRGFYAMFPQLGPSIGFILANGLFLIVRLNVSEENFASWGWRIPFIASLALVVVGLWVRVTVAETPAFKKAAESDKLSRVPFVELLQREWKHVLLGAGVMMLQYTLFYTATTYCLSYGTKVLGIPQQDMLLMTLLAVLALAAGTIASATLSDRLGRKKVLVAGAAAGVIWGFVMFPLINTETYFLVWLALAGALGIMGVTFGPMAAYLPELFPTRLRYSGAGLAYSVGGILGGSLPPIVATYLNANFGSYTVGLYISFVGLISLACTLAVRETKDTDISV